jgi:hypothetical protein
MQYPLRLLPHQASEFCLHSRILEPLAHVDGDGGIEAPRSLDESRPFSLLISAPSSCNPLDVSHLLDVS